MAKKKFHKVDKDAVRKQSAALGQTKFWTPKEGKNQIRILPPYSPKGLWYFPFTMHYGFKDEEDRDRAYGCFRAMEKTSCPACDAIEYLKKIDGGAKAAKRLAPKTKYYVNMIDRRIGDDKVFMYGITSARMLNEILSYDEDEDYGDIFDPEEGYDLIVDKTGSGMQTRYSIRIKPKPRPICEDIEELGDLFNLETEVPNDISKGEMTEMLKTTWGDLLEDFEFEDDTKSSKKKGKKVEDEDEDEDEDDEEEEKPKSKKKKAASSKKPKRKEEDEEEEDDDDDDDDEDEEEEVKPKKKKGRK